MEKSQRQVGKPFVSPYLKEPLRSLEEAERARQAKQEKLTRRDRQGEQSKPESDRLETHRVPLRRTG